MSELYERLLDPAAWPFPVERIEHRHTHISVVFLVGELAYKIKKPVSPGFLDFTTLALRERFCHEEVRLNRRLAPAVYLGVVPITEQRGRLRVEGEGNAIEWAVKMKRLPDAARLTERLAAGALDASLVEEIAGRVAAFHARAEAGPAIAASGRFEVVAGNMRENFAETRAQVGVTVTAEAWERARSATEAALEQRRELIAQRAAAGVPRDGHGDLHLDHVYHLPGRPAPDDLPIIDCIEFNTRFRWQDPVADMAFLAMDLGFRGRSDLARVYAEAWFAATRDAGGRALLPLYTAYLSIVRAKVNGMAAAAPDVPAEQREALTLRSRAHWLYALGALEPPGRRPALVLMMGLPGTGKSTLARALADRAGFVPVVSDRVRKELAGIAATESRRDGFGQGIYQPEWTERSYAECLARALARLDRGERVVVDASFADEGRRQRFLAAAARRSVPALLLHCEASAETACARLRARTGDASDADVAVYHQARARWQPPGPATARAERCIDTGAGPAAAIEAALDALRAAGLFAS